MTKILDKGDGLIIIVYLIRELSRIIITFALTAFSFLGRQFWFFMFLGMVFCWQYQLDSGAVVAYLESLPDAWIYINIFFVLVLISYAYRELRFIVVPLLNLTNIIITNGLVLVMYLLFRYFERGEQKCVP